MISTERRKGWSENELIRVLALYYQLPFGKMHSRTPAVIAYANMLGRTPSAVALKLVNFASLDPGLQRRGVRGMSNVSRLDRRVWHEYHDKWSNLAAVEDAETVADIQWHGRRTDATRMTVAK